ALDLESSQANIFLEELYNRSGRIKLGLERVAQVLDALGNPQEQTKHIVVAGTNGKGSAVHLLSQFLERSGYKVGRFTSPHLHRFGERICIQSQELDAAQFEMLYEKVRAAEISTAHELTFFEFITVMALLHFAAEEVDFSVLEVGLGGRLDATNIAPKFLSLITVIDFDHQEFLGNAIGDIAREKAGIIAQAGHVVIARQRHDAAERVLFEVAQSQQATIYRTSGPCATPCVSWDRSELELPEQHYFWDTFALLDEALHALRQLGVSLTKDMLLQAAKDFSWPGRYTWLECEVPVLLDGAHNPGALLALMSSLKSDPKYVGQPIHCVFSTLNNRPLIQMLEHLGACSDFYFCPNTSGRSVTRQALSDVNLGPVFAASAQAFAAAQEAALRVQGIVLITGSLFLVGEMMAHLKGDDEHRMVDG
ncbi:MAG: Mur ligase family protein, partial [Myxococcota bacterium]|nr:Mur ligase family protein [Myxococcota bacterium]